MNLLLAISGGIDSSVLLDIFARGKWDKLCLSDHKKGGLHLAYFNHGTPHGTKAEKLVQQLAEKYDLPLHIGSTKKKLTSEAAFRDARYAYFAKLTKKLGVDAVATAHHADDQAETILLNLTRGSGLAGLSRINEWSERDGLTIWRPLLSVQKTEIVKYARRHKLSFIDDPTNTNPKYARNRLRKHVLPELAKINPQIVSTLTRTAAQLHESHTALRAAAKKYLGTKTALPLASFAKLPTATQKEIVRLIHERELGHTQRLEEVHVGEILQLAQNPAGNKEKKCGRVVFRTGKQKSQRVLRWKAVDKK